MSRRTTNIETVSYNRCANTLRDSFIANDGSMSRSNFRFICLTHKVDYETVQVLFEATGLMVEQRVPGFKKADDRFCWEIKP